MKRFLGFSLAAFVLMAAQGAEKVFTGAVDGKWSTPGNWQDGAVPVDGDSVVVASTAVSVMQVDIEGLTLSGFTFSGYGRNASTAAFGAGSHAYEFSLKGKPFTLAAGGNFAITSGVRFYLTSVVELAEGAHELAIASTARLDVAGAGQFSGAGSLTLTQGLYIPYADTSFSGGFRAKTGAQIYVFANRPFGTGPAVIENDVRFDLYKAGVDIPNDIEFQGENNNKGNIYVRYSCAFSGTVTFTGQQRFKTVASATPIVLTFKGPVRSTSNNLFVTNLEADDFRHEIVFENDVTFGAREFWMDGKGSTVRFRKAGAVFGSTRLSGGQIVFEVPGACCETAWLGILGSSGARIRLEGDQVARRLFRYTGTDTGFYVTSETGGNLVLKATQSDDFPGGLVGRMGFVWAPTGAHTFTAQGETTFSGPLIVSNGVFEAAGALPNVSSLVAVNTGRISVPAGTVNTRLETLELASTATLALGAATDFTVDHLVVDGVDQADDVLYTGGAAAEGRVHLDALPENVTVYVRLRPGCSGRAEWTGLGGSIDRADLGVNWAGGAVPALGPKIAVDVTGGSSMTLAGDTAVNGLAYDLGQAFRVQGAGTLDLYWGGLSILNPASERENYAFDVPVRIRGEQTWRVDSGATPKSGRLSFNRPVSDDGDKPYTVYKTGGGFLFLNATNTFSGDLVVSNGQVVVQCSEGLGSAEQGVVKVVRASGTSPNLWLYPDVTVSRPVELYGPDSYYVQSDSRGICEFAGTVRIADGANKRFRANGTSTLLFSGGVEGLGMFYVQGDGRYVVTNRPVNTTGALYSDVKADITLAAPSNSVGHVYLGRAASVLRLGADDAFVGNPQIRFATGARLELNGHDVSFGNFLGSGSADTVDGVVHSDTAAEVRVSPRANLSIHAVFTGGASLRLMQTGMGLQGVSSSTGTLSCAQNCLTMMSGSGWTNGVVAVTNGNSCIQVAAGAQLGPKTDVRLGNGGKISLTQGVSLTCRNLYLDGVKQPLGTYGAAASAAQVRDDAYFWPGNTGVLRVLGDCRGTMLMIR